MSTSQPISQKPAAVPSEADAPAPVVLTSTARSKRLSGRWLPIAGGLIAAALAIGLLVWLWNKKGQSALAPPTGTVSPDPVPPVAPPPVKELAKPTTNPLPPRPSLAKRLETALQLAAKVPEMQSQSAGDERIQRWEIRFPNGLTSETYASQLDALGIELGVIGGGERIVYASGFSKDVPDKRDGPAADEARFYMTWRSGAMRDLDNALLSRVKISTSERIIAQFYPPQLEKTLADLEQKFAAPRNVAEVRHTVFALTPTDKAFEFRVVEQEFVTGELKKADAKPARPADKPPAAKPDE